MAYLSTATELKIYVLSRGICRVDKSKVGYEVLVHQFKDTECPLMKLMHECSFQLMARDFGLTNNRIYYL